MLVYVCILITSGEAAGDMYLLLKHAVTALLINGRQADHHRQALSVSLQ